MTTTYKVGYIVGSLSKASINRKLALALTRLAPKELHFQDIPIGGLPLYDYELENDFPAPAKALKDQIAALDAVIFVTPEYTRCCRGPNRELNPCRDRTRAVPPRSLVMA